MHLCRSCNDVTPRLRYLEQTSALAGFEQIPVKPQRVLYRLLHGIPAIRDYDRLYRFQS